MGGGCAYRAIPRKPMKAISISKEFYYLYGSVSVMEVTHVTAVSK
jgi:hypothetical protein